MERETFLYAYEGQNHGHYGIDLIDRYEGSEIKKFENYISDIGLSPSEIVSSLQDYHISVKGDIKLSGGQNDMRYFMEKTKRDFDGLIEAFGNSRVALLCGHYEITDEYEEDKVFGLLQRVYKPVDRITWISVVLMNYNEEPFTWADEKLLRTILEKFQDITGTKIGICRALEKEKYRILELLSVDFFMEIVRYIRKYIL